MKTENKLTPMITAKAQADSTITPTRQILRQFRMSEFSDRALTPREPNYEQLRENIDDVIRSYNAGKAERKAMRLGIVFGIIALAVGIYWLISIS